MSESVDLLIYVEDPGAANFIAPLIDRFKLEAWHFKLLAGGLAIAYLEARGILPDRVPADLSAEELLATISPHLLVVGTAENRDTLGLSLVTAARSANLKSVGVVDAPSNAKERFRGRSDRPLTYAPDYLLLPDPGAQDAYVALGYPRERAIVCGHPHYDTVRETRTHFDGIGRSVLRSRLFPEVPPEKAISVFIAEVSRGLDTAQYQRSPDYTLSGEGNRHGRTDIVLEELLRALDRLPFPTHRVLRLHPKNTREELAPYLDRFDTISEGGSPLELIYTADLVVGMTSTLLLEAALLARPTMAIVPRSVEKAWCAATATDLIPTVTQRRELLPNLVRLLSGNGVARSSALLPENCRDRVINWLKQTLTSPSSPLAPVVRG